MEENQTERIIKLEANYENLKKVEEANYKNLKELIDNIIKKQNETDITLHKQEVYQVTIVSKIDGLALDIRQFRDSTEKDRKEQKERLKKIEEERQEEKNQPSQSWNKIKISIITSIATGICLAIIYFLFNNIKF